MNIWILAYAAFVAYNLPFVHGISIPFLIAAAVIYAAVYKLWDSGRRKPAIGIVAVSLLILWRAAARLVTDVASLAMALVILIVLLCIWGLIFGVINWLIGPTYDPKRRKRRDDDDGWFL